MTNLIFKGNNIRTNGDMVCLTDMAKSYGKAVAHWLEIDATQAYLTALSVAIDIPIASILVVSNGKPTFAHPEVAIHFAQWLSPEFYVWCNRHIRTLVETGKSEVKPVAPIETKLMVTTGIERLNASTLPAAVKQLLIDSLINEYITDAPKLTASLERWVGVAQKAEELGYKVNSSSRVKLGHYAASQSDRLVCQKEERLCNGMMRKIWVYLDNSNLTQIIEEFYQIAAD
jgi:hypothetical protein